jgi:hypothetical protein
MAFDDDNVPHVHKSVFYYLYTNVTGRWHGMERHDHFGYCYGWSDKNCTILITNNVYVYNEDLCCMALGGNYGVPITWLKSSHFIGEEIVRGQKVNHWYGHGHEYWSLVDAPNDGVRYSGPNFKTPRQFTDYAKWQKIPIDIKLFALPKDRNCEQPCP